MRLIALVLILIAPTRAAAEKFDPKVTLAEIGPVYVQIGDEATGGCWTNIREAKNYAQDQIEITGGQTVEIKPEAYSNMYIYVHAKQQNNSGDCFGSIIITFERPSIYEYHRVYIIYSQISYIASGAKKFNTVVLDQIKRAVTEWKD